jgi:cytochrome c553
MPAERTRPPARGAAVARVAAAVVAGWLAGGLMTGAAWAQAPAPGASLTVPQRLALCAACHNADGRSTLADIPSLAAQPKVFLETQLVMIREGLRDIPQMKGQLDGVSDADLVAMAAHYAALPLVPQPAPRRADAFERGQALAGRALCNSCHLPTYLGQQQVPRVAGQREDYLLHTMRQFRDGKAAGRDSIMASSLYGMTDAQLGDLAHFLSQVK